MVREVCGPFCATKKMKKKYIILLFGFILLLFFNGERILVEYDKRTNNFREERVDKEFKLKYSDLDCNQKNIDSIAVYEVKDYWSSKESNVERKMSPHCKFQKKDSSILIYLGKSEKTSSSYILANKESISSFSWLNESTKKYNDFFKKTPLILRDIDLQIDTTKGENIILNTNIDFEFILYRKEDYFEKNPFPHWIKLKQCIKCLPDESTAKEILKNEEQYIEVNKKVIKDSKGRIEIIKDKLRMFL